MLEHGTNSIILDPLSIIVTKHLFSSSFSFLSPFASSTSPSFENLKGPKTVQGWIASKEPFSGFQGLAGNTMVNLFCNIDFHLRPISNMQDDTCQDVEENYASKLGLVSVGKKGKLDV
ncbi:hypothetical protein ROZALSC1DRAFT_25858 [Rozella allomycis CSF55]|uniref:Uncharacterized protein n=1 Tax=Rozella allomycis (strain CSF55) TaxID=988480 RepID=A0A4V1IYW1_ROZAC|nr:hypothetical protein ROZALSC1DRAFT_25858 [Rozella allomycis CSF55]